VGHLVGLDNPESYGWKEWSLSNIPMIPAKWNYQVLPGTKKQFKILQDNFHTGSLFNTNGGAVSK
jgi:DNA topoisomerase-3